MVGICCYRKRVLEGFALYYIRYSTLERAAVIPGRPDRFEQMRGKGLGKLLFDGADCRSKRKKYSGMVWQVLDWNETRH